MGMNGTLAAGIREQPLPPSTRGRPLDGGRRTRWGEPPSSSRGAAPPSACSHGRSPSMAAGPPTLDLRPGFLCPADSHPLLIAASVPQVLFENERREHRGH